MKALSTPADLEEILTRLRTVRPDSVRRWGTMSAPEMIVHLSDSFRTAFGERAASPAGGPLGRTVIKWIALHLPIHWPRNVPTRPENDPHAAGTRPGDFAADVDDLVRLCERFARTRGTWAPHPAFGQLSDEEWQRWGYLHMDHHLRQFGA